MNKPEYLISSKGFNASIKAMRANDFFTKTPWSQLISILTVRIVRHNSYNFCPRALIHEKWMIYFDSKLSYKIPIVPASHKSKSISNMQKTLRIICQRLHIERIFHWNCREKWTFTAPIIVCRSTFGQIKRKFIQNIRQTMEYRGEKFLRWNCV